MDEARIEPASGFLELRHAATDHPIFVVVPSRQLLVIDGAGLPGAADFRMATDVLRAVHAAIRARLRRDRFTDGPKAVLEIAWHTDDLPLATAIESFAEGKAIAWRQMLELPKAGTATLADGAIQSVRREAGRDVALVRLISYDEGRAAQILHLGGTTALAPSISRLAAFVAEAGLRPRGRLHQLVYGDANVVPSGRARSILRLPVG